MLDVLLHTGTEHPDMLWVAVPSILSFAAGVGIGASSDSLRAWLGTSAPTSGE